MGKSGISIGVINNLMIKVPGKKIIASNLGHFDLGTVRSLRTRVLYFYLNWTAQIVLQFQLLVI